MVGAVLHRPYHSFSPHNRDKPYLTQVRSMSKAFRVKLKSYSISATKKYSESGGNDRFHFGISEMQGWRIGKSSVFLYILQATNVWYSLLLL